MNETHDKELVWGRELIGYMQSRGWDTMEGVCVMGRVIGGIILTGVRGSAHDKSPLTESQMRRYEASCDELAELMKSAVRPEMLPPSRRRAS